MTLNCGNCGSSKKNSQDGVYCLLFGIMIRGKHEGCKYHRGKSGANDTRTERDGREEDERAG